MKKNRKWLLSLALIMLGLFTACGTAGSDRLQGSGYTVVSEAAETAGTEEAAEAAARIAAAPLESADDTEGLLQQTDEEETAASEELTDEVHLDGLAKDAEISEDGRYTGKDEVALYLHLFGHLPDNYITKKEAKALGWDASIGNLWEVAPDKSIGGDYFGNFEGLLPEEDDRDYFECDIDYNGGRRNAKRIIYSNDGLIFYTEDHYESFEQLYEQK